MALRTTDTKHKRWENRDIPAIPWFTNFRTYQRRQRALLFTYRYRDSRLVLQNYLELLTNKALLLLQRALVINPLQGITRRVSLGIASLDSLDKQFKFISHQGRGIICWFCFWRQKLNSCPQNLVLAKSNGSQWASLHRDRNNELMGLTSSQPRQRINAWDWEGGFGYMTWLNMKLHRSSHFFSNQWIKSQSSILSTITISINNRSKQQKQQQQKQQQQQTWNFQEELLLFSLPLRYLAREHQPAVEVKASWCVTCLPNSIMHCTRIHIISCIFCVHPYSYSFSLLHRLLLAKKAGCNPLAKTCQWRRRNSS